MKANRRLNLRRETLHSLDADVLSAVVGGTHIRTDCGCVSHGYTCDACEIPSLPLNTCIFSTGDLVISCGMCLS